MIKKEILSISFTDKDLCCRCGTCVGVCPTNALTLDESLYPKIDPDKCNECGLCAKTCPGSKVHFRYLTKLTFGHEKMSDHFDGHVQKLLVGHALDPEIRSAGAGGGVITGLFWDLMKNRKVDGCIATRMQPDKPWIGETFIAGTYEDLLRSQGSRYMIIPVNHILQRIRHLPGKYAIAALPCQVHGLRMACEEDPVLKEKIHVIIGLFCGGSLEPLVVTEMLKTRGLKTGDISDFQFRGGKWPGKIRAVLKSGKIANLHYSNYKDGAYNYLIQLYMPKRCQTCIDGSNEFSDISVSDAWTRDKQGKYKFKMHSKILVRTQKGQQVIQAATNNRSIYINDVSKDLSYQTHKLQTKRKGISAPLRVARMVRKGKPAPEYDRTISDATTKEKLMEQAASFTLWLGQYRFFRYSLVKLLTSELAIPMIKTRNIMKKRKYKRLH